jgi:hypothetical protein
MKGLATRKNEQTDPSDGIHAAARFSVPARAWRISWGADPIPLPPRRKAKGERTAYRIVRPPNERRPPSDPSWAFLRHDDY